MRGDEMVIYDLIVIGTGIASVPARKAAAEGWKVAIIDELPPGGTCALRGCTPKKYLRSGAEVIDTLRRMEGKGIIKGDVTGSWSDLQKHRYEYTTPIPENNKKSYASTGIDFFHGTASFTNENELKVISADDEKELGFKNCVIATGACPIDLTFPGNELALSSDDFLELPELPSSMIFIGGGFISMEYAHIASRFGVKTQVLQRGPLPLKAFDPDLVEKLVEVGKEHAGIDVKTNRVVVSIEKMNSGKLKCVVKNSMTKEEESYTVDSIVHGAGRRPNIDRLNLSAAGIEYTSRGISVNEYLQSTSSPHIFSAGDCANTGAPQLSFTASREGVTLSKNLLEGLKHKVNYAGQASVAFTLPAIAQAGLTEEQATAEGLKFEVKLHDSPRWFTNRRLNEGAGAAKVLIEKGSGRIIGAHFLAHHCEEFINVFALAIHHNMTRDDLKSVPWAHPTSASDISRILG